MIVFYILDEGLPVEMNTGWSIPEGRKAYDKVGNMQSAIKFLVKNKDTAACKVQDIEIYPLGVTKAMYDKGGPSLPKPLKPTDKLPEGSSKQNAIFVHVPRAKQQLSPDLRSFYVQPVPVKKMARPEIDMLIISPKRKKKTMPRKMIEMTVKCTHNDKEFKKMIDPKNTISQLKEKFAEPSGVPASNQNLFVNGNELADDDEMAKDAGIKHRSTIYLEPKTIQVTVRTPDSKHIPVTMKQTDTIQFLKEQVAPESGVEVADQNLKYHGNLLSNDKTARESGLEDGAIIDLMPNTINVTVRAPDGKNIPVTMKPTDTTEFIKEKVAPISGIEVPKQILKFQGNVMPDKKTAGAMGLKDGSVLDLSTPVEKEKKKKMEKEDKDDDCKLLPLLYLILVLYVPHNC